METNTETKACTRCRQVLDITEFNFKDRAHGRRQLAEARERGRHDQAACGVE
jgi:hypothetical protein